MHKNSSREQIFYLYQTNNRQARAVHVTTDADVQINYEWLKLDRLPFLDVKMKIK